MMTVIVELPNRCDIVRLPAKDYAALAFTLNCCPDCRYWIQRSADRLPAIVIGKGGVS